MSGAGPKFSAIELTDCRRSSGFEQAELRERRHAVVETDLLDDLAVLKRSTVVPVKRILRPGRGRQRADRKSLKAGPVCVPPPSHWPTT